MKHHRTTALLYGGLLLTFACTACKINSSGKQKHSSKKDADKTLLLQSAIKLNNVKGGFDLMDIDAKGQRLFLAPRIIIRLR